MQEFFQHPNVHFVLFVLFGACVIFLFSRESKRKPLPPSDLERVEFLRRGNDGTLWRFSLDGPDAVLWDECQRRNLYSSKGFKELNWKKEKA